MLACELCDEYFDTHTHKPECLTCGHTYCFACISTLLERFGTKICLKCPDESDDECEEILCCRKSEPSGNMMVPEIKRQLDSATQTCNWLSTYNTRPELLPDGTSWTVTDHADGQQAIASLLHKRMPKHLMVISTHTRPIFELRNVIAGIAAQNVGNICLMPMASFWRELQSMMDEDIGTIITEFGDHLVDLYGTPDQILAHSNTGKCVPRSIGVRLASHKDVVRCTALAEPIDDICCLRGIPSSTGCYLKTIKKICRWHFLDLCNIDLDWMFEIVSCSMTSDNSCPNLVLPRDKLTHDGVKRLFETLSKWRSTYSSQVTIYCEPQSKLMLSPTSEKLKCAELSIFSILQWKSELTGKRSTCQRMF